MRKKGTTIFLLVVLCFTGKSQATLSNQFHLDIEELHQHLETAPLLDDLSTQSTLSVTILLPTPKGTQHAFQVWEDPILSQDLQAQFPNYQTFYLQSEEASMKGRLMLSPTGMDAVIIHNDQVMFIEPVEASRTLHRIYYWKLGPNYLSFELEEGGQEGTSLQNLRLAVLVDEEYAAFHQEDLTRAIISSVNGVNAFLQHGRNIRLDLHYFSQVNHSDVLACRVGGFGGRTAESIKLFGDLIASGALHQDDFDLGHLFSGRGFGGNSLRNVAGKNAFYDWNEDQIFDGPAKAGGGTGTIQPVGADWWGNLCKGINRQIGSTALALQVQKAAQIQEDVPGMATAGVGNLEHFPVTMKHYSGPRAMGELDFPHLSCLPFGHSAFTPLNLYQLTALPRIPIPSVQLGLTDGMVWPLYLQKSDEVAVRAWLQGWRL